MRFLLLLALGFSATLASSSEKPPKILEPTGPWVVDYAANNCRLVRAFGTDKEPTKLIFEQLVPHSVLSVMVVGKIYPAPDKNVLSFDPLPGVQIRGGDSLAVVGSGDSAVLWPRRFGRGRWGLIPDTLADQMKKTDPIAWEESNGAPSDAHSPHLKWKDHTWRVEDQKQWDEDAAAFNARADKITAVVLNPGRSGSISLHTGGLAQPLEALGKCVSDSLKDWGIDPAVQSTIATGTHPASDPASVFSSDDYPRAAWMALKEDKLEVWLNIDAKGHIAGCRAISDFATPEINDAICGMIRRKEIFVPARTKNGSPVPDFYVQSFEFKID